MPEHTPEERWARVQAYVRQCRYPGVSLAQLAKDARDVYFHVYGTEPPEAWCDLRRLVTRVLLTGVYDSPEGVLLRDCQDPPAIQAAQVVALCRALAQARGWPVPS